MADAKDINVAAGKVLRTGKAVQGFAKLASRKSIMTMAQPGMYQYPIVASTGIDTDVLMAISKAYQLTYASNVATAYSLNPIMYLKDTSEISDFVQKFHTNTVSPINTNFDGIGDAIGAESYIDIPDDAITVEGAVVNENYTKEDYAVMNTTAWNNFEDSVTMESLNDMYRPYDRTYRVISDKVKTMKVANEDFNDKLDSIHNFADQINQTVNSQDNYSTGFRTSVKGKNDVVRNNQLEAMEPTMVNVQIVCHGNNQGQFTRNVTLGIKTMPRLISSDLMIASMVEACKNTHGIFKFLKWTKGEVKTLDFILGFSASKAKALEKNAKQEVKFMKQSAARKKINGIGRFFKNEVLPTLTVVMTSYEVAKVKEACGVDLSDIKHAAKLMSKYYLLSFAIYDTDQGTIKVLFDCDKDWGYTSISMMRSLIDKTKDVLNQNEILRLTGRR